MPRKELRFKITENGCYEPISHRGDDGHSYPVYTINKKSVRIYRHLFEQKYGPVAHGLCVRHTCDNTKCINVNHLLIGTRAQNMHDKLLRGRTGKGEKNGRSKIMEEDALFILRSCQATKKLAKKFKVSNDTILSIRSGKRWGHLHSTCDKPVNYA